MAARLKQLVLLISCTVFFLTFLLMLHRSSVLPSMDVAPWAQNSTLFAMPSVLTRDDFASEHRPHETEFLDAFIAAAPRLRLLKAGTFSSAKAALLNHVPVSERKKVLLLSNCIGESHRTFCEYTSRRLDEYAELHGYTSIVYSKALRSPVPTWQKIYVLKKHLDESVGRGKHAIGHYDIVVWYDDDIFISNMDIPIENFFRLADNLTHSENHIIFSRDYRPNTPFSFINAGTFMLKASNVTLAFLQKVIDLYDQYEYFHNNYYHEQSVLTLVFFKWYAQYGFVFPMCFLQSFFNDMYNYLNQWSEGDYAIHFISLFNYQKRQHLEYIDKHGLQNWAAVHGSHATAPCVNPKDKFSP